MAEVKETEEATVDPTVAAPGPATGTRYEGNEDDVPTWYEGKDDFIVAHERKGEYDPKTNGPFLDEVRIEEQAVRLEMRAKAREAAAEKAAKREEKKTAKKEEKNESKSSSS